MIQAMKNYYCCYCSESDKKTKKRRFWARNIFLQRPLHGTFYTLFQELMKDDELFFRYHRMTPARFEHLLSLVEDQITKKRTNFREPISARERLSVTLRFLATGESQQSLSFSYRIGRNTVSTIVTETCEALFTCLQAEYLRAPINIEEWQEFPHSLKTYGISPTLSAL